MDSKRHLELLADSPAEPEALMLVGELAKAAGKTVRAIHLYEDLGLLKPQDRSKGRYRLFGADSLLRVRWIVKLQSLGLSLSDIQDLARNQADADSALFAATRLREVYVNKLNETRAKLQELRALEHELEQSLRYLDDCDSHCEPAVPTAGCSSCDRHETQGAPELVLGAQAH
ncbi:MAG: MerR family transcriptional regulator [Polyangiaceae bacterium]